MPAPPLRAAAAVSALSARWSPRYSSAARRRAAGRGGTPRLGRCPAGSTVPPREVRGCQPSPNGIQSRWLGLTSFHPPRPVLSRLRGSKTWQGTYLFPREGSLTLRGLHVFILLFCYLPCPEHIAGNKVSWLLMLCEIWVASVGC